jgi:PAS domain S-box-containing protein
MLGLRIVGIAVAYFLTGKFGLMFAAYENLVTLIWYPTGLSVAAYYRWGNRIWPGIFVGSLAVNLTSGGTIQFSILAAVGNTLGPMLSAVILRKSRFRESLDSPHDLALLILAAIPGMLVSSISGVSSLNFVGLLNDQFMLVWSLWFGGDFMGVLMVSPVLFLANRQSLIAVKNRAKEAVVWCVLTLSITWTVFAIHREFSEQSTVLTFLPLPLVAWSVLRFGPLGTPTAAILMSLAAAIGTSRWDSISFLRIIYVDDMVMIWGYMTTLVILGWLINLLHLSQIKANYSHRMLENALQEISTGVVLTGSDRNITFVNEGFCRLTGYSPEELLHKNCNILQGKETHPDTLEQLRKSLAAGESFDGELLNYRKDGTPFWNALLVTPLRDEKNQLTGFLGVQRDVTNKMQAELEKKQSDERFKAILDLIPVCIKIVSPEGRLLDMNPAGLAMIEADSFDQVCRAVIGQLIDPEHMKKYDEMLQKNVAGEPAECEFSISGLKGAKRWLHSHGIPYKNFQGEIIGSLGITRDITLEKLSSLELAANLNMLKQFIDSVPALIGFIDNEQKIQLVNQHAEKFFQVPASQLLGLPLGQLFNPEEFSVALPQLLEAYSGKMVNYQTHGLRPDGSTMWFDIRYIPRFVSDGRVDGVFAVVFDITSSKNAERELADNRSRLDGILNSIEEVVYSASPSGDQIYFINQYAKELYGLDPQEFYSNPMKWLQTVHPEDRARVEQSFEFLSENGWFDQTYRIVRPDGTIRWVQDRAKFIVDAQGNRLRLDGTLVDITDRQIAEERLKASETRYRDLFRANPHPMWVYDLESLRFLAVNNAAIAHYGFSRNEFLEMTIKDIRPPEDIHKLLKNLKQTNGGFDMAGVWRHRLKNGKLIHVTIKSHVIEFDGRKAEVVLAEDITDRLRDEIRNDAEKAVLELLASAAPLEDILQQTALYVEKVDAEALCSILLMDQETKRLVTAAAPSLDPEYCSYINGVEIGPNKGACGTAAYLAKRVIATDISNDPLWAAYKDVTTKFHLKACWSNPIILSDNKVVGTLAVYFTNPKKPDESHIALVERATHFAALALERHELLQNLRESQTRLETLVGNLPGMAYRCVNDQNRTMIYVGSGCKELTGFCSDELTQDNGKRYSELIHPDDREIHRDESDHALKQSGLFAKVFRMIDRSNRTRWVMERASGVYADDGTLRYIDGFIQDITDSRNSEELVRASLREKEAMLQEIHHRVKNNLQIITSLLNLQADSVQNPIVINALRESQNRVRSMALVHETLYRSGDLGRIDIRDYADSLCRFLFRSYGVDTTLITLNLDIADVSLDLDRALPFGLIINELVTNSLKYAFPAGKSGTISVSLSQENGDVMSLIVKDSGIGLPTNLDLKNIKSLGLQLINDLINQLGGSLIFVRGKGTEVRMRIPIALPVQEYAQ